MKCYLHIGTEKTGTTAIQQFLWLNRKSLKSRGYLIPVSTGRISSRKLPVAAYNLDRRDDFTRRYKLNDNQSLQLFQRSILEALSRELLEKTEKTDSRTIVFSSEHIHSRLRTQEEVGRLKTILSSLGFSEITVIVYLRSPIALASSLYSTAVKSGATDIQPPPPEHEYYRNLCDHRATMLKYRQEFGHDAVVPRLYEKRSFVNGSIFADFLTSIGISEAHTDFNLPGRSNRSMNDKGIGFLLKFNKLAPFGHGGLPTRLLRRIVIAWSEKYFKGDSPYRISPELTKRYELAFADSNEWVRREYFPERPELFHSNEV